MLPDVSPRGTLLERYGLPPAAIEQLSLARIETLAGNALPSEPGARQLVRRVVYAAGDPHLAASVEVHPAAVRAGVDALRRGATVVVDVRMVAAGLRQEALRQLGCSLVVAIEVPEARRVAEEANITRSAAAFRGLSDHLSGAVVAIGNAPTALLELLDLVDAGVATPAVIVGMPVGLVAAAESKDELRTRTIPYATVVGTRGGSAMAAAAVNALLELAVAADGAGDAS